MSRERRRLAYPPERIAMRSDTDWLRTPFFVGLYLSLFFALLAVLGQLVLRFAADSWAEIAAASLVEAAVIVGGTVLFARYVDRRTAVRETLPFPHGSWPQVLVAFAAGAGLMLGLLLVEWLLGWLRIVAARGDPSTVAATGLLDLVLFGTAAVIEETVFRGYIFAAVRRSAPAWSAVVLSSLLFAGAHVTVPGANAAFLCAILLFGILMGATRELSGALWFPVGFHAGWNWLQFLAGIPFGSQTDPRSLVVVDETGPAWLSGSGSTFEGGLGPLLALALVIVVAVRRAARSPVSRAPTARA